MFISDAPPGASFKVLRVVLDKEVGRRLADMGFTEGAEGAVVRSGFFRGPLQVRIRGYDILIRRVEAAGIEVEPVGDWTAAEDASRRGFGRFFGPGPVHGAGPIHGHGPGRGHGGHGHGGRGLGGPGGHGGGDCGCCGGDKEGNKE